MLCFHVVTSQPQHASHSKWADHPLTVFEQIVSTQAHMSPWDMKPSTTWFKLDITPEAGMRCWCVTYQFSSIFTRPSSLDCSTVKGDSMVVKAEWANQLLGSWSEKCKTRVKTRIRVRGSSIYCLCNNSGYRHKYCKLLWVHEMNFVQPLCVQGALILPFGVILAKILMQVSSSQSREVWPAARRLDELD